MIVNTWGRVCCLAWLLACQTLPESASEPNAAVDPPAAEIPPAAAAGVADEQALARAEQQTCAALIRDIHVTESAPVPGLQQRVQVLASAKGLPLVFWRAPIEPATPRAAHALRRELLLAEQPALLLMKRLPRLRKDPALARAVLLSEGYLYAETPALAHALVTYIRLEDLFLEPALIIQRGSDEFRVSRTKRGYFYTTGPSVGERARLLLFDRVVAAAELPGPALEPLHTDLAGLAAASGFERAEFVRLGPTRAHARLRYAEHWVDSVLERRGSAFSLRCQLTTPELATEITAARSLAKRRARVHGALLRAVEAQVSEALPFDEPKNEDGQQDGQLRPEWTRAYRDGRLEYVFNEDRYRVFDQRGRPRVPQVCIDFVTDTFERAGGSWWRSLGEPRERAQGRLNFSRLAIDNRRSVEQFLLFAASRPDWFDVVTLPEEERVPFQRRAAFFEHLGSNADRYRPGDIIVILGLRDDEKLHYHSFFVAAADPLTGAPIWVAGNAGQPRVRAWFDEMASAPRRYIYSRIRPRLEWLESVLELEQNVTQAEPAPGGAARTG